MRSSEIRGPQRRQYSIATACITLYLCLAPVYWLPGVPLQVLTIGKYALVGIAVCAYWSYVCVQGNVVFPRGLPGWAGFVVISLASATACFQAESNQAFARFVDIVLGFAMLWTCYGLFRKQRDPVPVFLSAATAVTLLSAVVILAAVVPSIEWTAPAEFRNQNVVDVGFGGSRTGWSNGIALYLPLALGGLTLTRQKVRWRRIVALICIMAIVGSQLVVGGRAGLLASIIALVIVGRRMIGVSSSLALIGLAAVLATVNVSYWYEHLRIDRWGSSASVLESINSISANRIESIVQALILIKDRPIIGHGFGGYTLVGFEGMQIHNLWFRLAVEGGLILPLVFMLITTSFLVRANRWGASSLHKRIEDASWLRTLQAVLVAGVVVSMFEPNALLGTFQNSAVWWAVAGAVVARRPLNDASHSRQYANRESPQTVG